MESIEQVLTFGSQIKELRDGRKLSQRDVEGSTGVSSAYLSQLENDKVKKPSPFILHKLAKLYGVSYELMMTHAGYITARNEEGMPKTLVGAALLTNGQLTEEEERHLASYLEFFRSQKKKPE